MGGANQLVWQFSIYLHNCVQLLTVAFFNLLLQPPKYSLDPAHRSKFNLMPTNGAARDISPSIDQAPPPTPKSDPPTLLMPSAELNGHSSKVRAPFDIGVLNKRANVRKIG
jgi:hypothetical protein